MKYFSGFLLFFAMTSVATSDNPFLPPPYEFPCETRRESFAIEEQTPLGFSGKDLFAMTTLRPIEISYPYNSTTSSGWIAVVPNSDSAIYTYLVPAEDVSAEECLNKNVAVKASVILLSEDSNFMEQWDVWLSSYTHDDLIAGEFAKFIWFDRFNGKFFRDIDESIDWFAWAIFHKDGTMNGAIHGEKFECKENTEGFICNVHVIEGAEIKNTSNL